MASPSRPAANTLGRATLWWVVVGVSALLVYQLAGHAALMAGAPPGLAGSIGFAVSLPISYGGQKRLTFRSSGRHRDELPRFIAMSVAGVALAAGLAQGLPALGLSERHAVTLAILVVPVSNLIIMRLWVFARAT